MNTNLKMCLWAAVGAVMLAASQLAYADYTPKTYFVTPAYMDPATPQKEKIFTDSRAACNYAVNAWNRRDVNFTTTRLIAPLPVGSNYDLENEMRNEGSLYCRVSITRINTTPHETYNAEASAGTMRSPCQGEGPLSYDRESFGSGYGNTAEFRRQEDLYGYAVNARYNVGGNRLKTCQCLTPTTQPSGDWRQVGNRCVPNATSGTYKVEEKNAADKGSVCSVGNPVNPATGAKYLTELDYSGGGGPLGLRFERTYNSQVDRSNPTAGIGHGWRHSYSKFLSIDTSDTLLRVQAVRPNGGSIEFREQADGSFAADSDVNDRLVAVRDAGNVITSYRLTFAQDESTETYNAAGQVQSLRNRGGWSQTFAWSQDRIEEGADDLVELIAPDAGYLLSVTDQTGRSLQFRYNDAGFIRRLTDPAGGHYVYEYDDNENLTRVTNPRSEAKTYHYNESTHIAQRVPENPGDTVEPVVLPNALTGITDASNTRLADYHYQADGRASRTTHADGYQNHQLTYNEDGSTTVTDPVGAVRTYQFAVTQGVAQQQDQNVPCSTGSPNKSAAYDANGNPTRTIDFNDNLTSYTHDPVRNLETSRTEGLNAVDGTARPESRTISTRWHATWRQPERIAQPLKRTDFEYDANGNLRVMTERVTLDTTGVQGLEPALDPQEAPRVWTYTYNDHGQVRTVNDPRTDINDTTTYEYYTSSDSQTPPRWRVGDLQRVTNALGHIVEFQEYTEHGAVKRSVDANQLVTQYEYDELGRLRQQLAAGLTTTYAYNNRGLLERVTSPDASFVLYAYNAAHQLNRVEDSFGNSINYPVIDGMGNRRSEEVRDPQPQGTLRRSNSRIYTTLNRLEQVIGGTDAATQITRYEYDVAGNLRHLTDPRSRVTSRTYDALNRVVDLIQPVPEDGQARPTTTYGYNGQDRVTSVRDPRQLTTSYTVNGLGDNKGTTSPDSGVAVNTYDAAGNLKTSTDARSQITSYDYDALNRVTVVRLHDNSTQTYAYDSGTNAVGRLSSITERDAANAVQTVLSYHYDSLGRVQRTVRSVAGRDHEVVYGYNPVGGRLATITYPSGRVITYGHDAQGRVNAITTTPAGGSAQAVLSGVQYFPFGGVSQFSFSNGQVFRRNYDLDGRTDQYTLGARTFSVGYDRADQIESITQLASGGNPATTNFYEYDGLSRLLLATLPAGSHGYRYDALGNRTRSLTGGNTVVYTYPAGNNRLTNVGGAAQAFDDNGSVTGNATAGFGYDVRGRMRSSTGAAGTTNYHVDAQGLRIRKTNAQGDTVFVYDGAGRLISEHTPAGIVTKEYIYLGDIPVAVVAQ